MINSNSEFDTIIVGAGSAGCVLANRLTENPNHRVLLLEAGGKDWHPFIHMPAGLAKLVGYTWMNWNYETDPEAELDSRRLYWPRGKVLGGSSSINAMCYCRGHRLDYDSWAEQGNVGWGFDHVLPYFKKAEDQERGASEFHGSGGPLSVSNLRHTNPLSAVFIQAAQQAGFPHTDDFNGARQEGFGYYQVTQRNGQRCSAAVAYLKPALERSNLSLMTRTRAQQVLLDGDRATGLRVMRRGRQREIHAGRVILSSGAINSPQLLLLSGIGPGDHLAELGVPVRHELPGVGQNLQDHLDICTLMECTEPLTYDKLNEFAAGLEYFFRKSGPGTSNIAEAGGFVASRHAEDERPDIQMHFVPGLLDDHGRNKLPGYGMTIHACPLRPKSRGEIQLATNDAGTAPLIRANYLSHEYDIRIMLECVRLARKIYRQPAFSDFIGKEIFPGVDHQTDEQLLSFIRRKAETIYHPSGTCKMGVDPMAVVDTGLNVHGLNGLNVVDTSVMPELISGNTNAPTIMIAEKFAAMQNQN